MCPDHGNVIPDRRIAIPDRRPPPPQLAQRSRGEALEHRAGQRDSRRQEVAERVLGSAPAAHESGATVDQPEQLLHQGDGKLTYWSTVV